MSRSPPSTNILRERTQRELIALRRRIGISFVVVTHDQDEAMSMADPRGRHWLAGRFCKWRPPRELYERPAKSAPVGGNFFGDVNIWEGR